SCSNESTLRLPLASSAPSVPTPEPLATSGLNSTASITASSMTLTHWSRPSASRPLHDNTTEREQNPHYGHDNGLRFFADCCCEKGAPSGQLEIKTPLYLPCPSWATD